MTSRTLMLVLVGALARVPSAQAWGKLGHQIVGNVAEHYVEQSARTQITALLGANGSLADVANWADEIRRSKPETGPWHYVNVPPDADAFDRQRDCTDGQCVVARLEHFAQTLADRGASAATRRDALKFLVHFVGDLHQPLHCGYEADRGGNDIKLTWFGGKTDLHKLWDTSMIERQKLTARQYADELIADIDDADRAAWVRGQPADWATESFTLAVKYAYRSTRGRPLASGDHVGRAYFADNVAVVDQQLSRAGVRLAAMINAALAASPATAPATRPE